MCSKCSLVARKYNKRELERKSESFFIIWYIFQSTLKMFRNHYGHRYHQNTFQRYYNVFWALQLWWKCRIFFTLLLIIRERFWTSWNPLGVREALGQSTKNSFPVVLRPHVFTRRSSNFWNSKVKTARPFEFLFTPGWRRPRNKSL